VVLANLGVLDAAQGRGDDALLHYQQALAAQREVGDRRPEALILGNLGFLLADLGRREEALEQLRGALVLARAIGDRRCEANVRGRLGALHAEAGEAEDALTCFREAEALLRVAGERFDLGKLLCQRAEALAPLDPGTARADAAEAGRIADALGLGPESEIRRRLEALRARLGDPPPTAGAS
jgi:tetratricopeptide (TPR) repeat protein